MQQATVELKLAGMKRGLEPGDELPAEDAAQCVNRQEETWRRIYPSGTIESEAASGNDVVDVGMMTPTATIP